MKFDFIIGNPPYQEEQGGDNKTFAPPIYHLFMEESYKIADVVELIHPARFLYNAGSTPKDWNKKMLSDPHFKILFFEQSSGRIFANTEIKGGVVISIRNSKENYGAIGTFSPHGELLDIAKKAGAEDITDSLASIVFTQSKFNLQELYKDYPEFENVIGSGGKDKRFRNNIFEKIHIFKETGNKNDIAVLGVIKNKRCWRYIPKKYVDSNHENMNKWKVVIPRANGTGALGEILSSPTVISPGCGYTQTFIGIGAFDTEIEADNLLKYIKTKFLRALLSVLKVDQHNEKDTWLKIPLQDFSSASDIDWSRSITDVDAQLYKKYKLTKEDIGFIESHVKEME